MNDRLDFSKSIEMGNASDQIVINWFNEIMLLFNLVNKYPIKSVKGTESNSSEVIFDIEFAKTKDAKEASSIMTSNKLTIYDEDYSLSNIANKNIVTVNISKL